MNEISHRTETATTTQTVETDDGKGNIIVEEVEVTATTLYITVTHKTTDEMADIYNFTADQREMLAELLAEESNGMWSAVLYGIGTGDGEIVTVALSQLGNVGGQPYWSWYGFESRVDWCACFVSWCANECGYLDAGVIPKFASCSIGIQWFRERGLWQDGSYEPRPGDLIFSTGTMRTKARTERQTMWASWKRWMAGSSTPWRATQAMPAGSVSTPLDTLRSMDTVRPPIDVFFALD